MAAVAAPTAAMAVVRPPVRPETLSIPELCLAGRRSYLALLDTPHGTATGPHGRHRRLLTRRTARAEHGHGRLDAARRDYQALPMRVSCALLFGHGTPLRLISCDESPGSRATGRTVRAPTI